VVIRRQHAEIVFAKLSGIFAACSIKNGFEFCSNNFYLLSANFCILTRCKIGATLKMSYGYSTILHLNYFFKTLQHFLEASAIKMSTSFVATIFKCFRQLTIIHIYLTRYPSKKYMKSLGKSRKTVSTNKSEKTYFQKFWQTVLFLKKLKLKFWYLLGWVQALTEVVTCSRCHL